jgi:hypothetical protein
MAAVRPGDVIVHDAAPNYQELFDQLEGAPPIVQSPDYCRFHDFSPHRAALALWVRAVLGPSTFKSGWFA